MDTHIIILAAGKGTRMRSSKPKVIQKIANKPMLSHIVECVAALKPVSVNIIVGYQSNVVKKTLEASLENTNAEINEIQNKINWVEQQEQLGTAHAVRQVLPVLPKDGMSIILFGDVPLISSQTLSLLESQVTNKSLGLITQHLPKPTGYGRIVRNDNDEVCEVVEQKDANIEQLLINEVNTGIMAVNNAHLHEWLPQIKNENAQQEYYLPDLIPLAVEANVEIKTLEAQHDYEVQGVNNKSQMVELENIYQHSKAQEFLEQGLHIIDPQRFDLRGELSFGEDCVIDINCIFEEQVKLADNVSIGANCIIKNATIGNNVVIKSNSLIEDSVIDENCEVGPFARIRPDTHLHAGAKIGNFVETKNSNIGEGSKVNHLSYIGDAEIGTNSNIGAGTITCNYDGVNKYKTSIGSDVRIGSNSSLVAPLLIGDKATTGAGSVIRKDVKANELAVNSAAQKNISGWKRPEKQS